MKQIDWFNIVTKDYDGIKAVVQEGYMQRKEPRGYSKGNTYGKLHAFRVIVKERVGKRTNVKIHYFNDILFPHVDVMEHQLTWWLRNFRKHMSKTLQKGDFIWIPVDKEKNNGYFSYKDKGTGFEICLDYDILPKWTVFLCNNFEEVLEEKEVISEEEAIDKANEFFCSISTMIM